MGASHRPHYLLTTAHPVHVLFRCTLFVTLFGILHTAPRLYGLFYTGYSTIRGAGPCTPPPWSSSTTTGVHVCCTSTTPAHGKRVHPQDSSTALSVSLRRVLKRQSPPFAARRLAGSAAGAGAACASRARRAARRAQGNAARGCTRGGSSQAARGGAGLRGRAMCTRRRAAPRRGAWVCSRRRPSADGGEAAPGGKP